MKEFRFEDFEIWKNACDVGDELCTIADELGEKKLWGFADQLRRAALSISNNIAEGSGSEHPKDFQNFLNHARRSTFECASMIMFFHRKGLISDKQKEAFSKQLAMLSKMILNFKRSIV
jgi:four helix bundle protein